MKSSRHKFEPLNESCDNSKMTTSNKPFPKDGIVSTVRSADSSILSKLSKTSLATSNQRFKEIVQSIGLTLNFECHLVCPPELGVFSTRFEVVDVIARGSFGCVKKCVDLLNDKYRACKKIYCIPSEPTTPAVPTDSTDDINLSHVDGISSSSATVVSNPFISSLRRDNRNNKGKVSIENIYMEIFILHQMDHPNIIRLFSVYVQYLVFLNIHMWGKNLESCCFLRLFTLNNRPIIDIPTHNGLAEGLIRTYLRDILCAIEYIHSRNIAHCDVKPSNILVFEKHLLCDFGSSIITNNINNYIITNSNRPKTSLAFQSPEYLLCEVDGSISLTSCDVWSLGITTYSMITGNIPWSSFAIGTLINDIEKSPVKFPSGLYVNPCLEEIVLRMLAKNPKQRITVDVIKRNSWLTLAGRWPFN